MAPPTIVLFDLDGTLADPFQGITLSYVHTLTALGIESPPAAALGRLIGPPLRQAMRTLLEPYGRAAEVERAVAIYRERYGAVGLFENRLYDGIPELLAALAPRRRMVVTSKPRVFAERIIVDLGLAACFDGIFGPELDGTHDDKADLMRHALAVTGTAPAAAVMIGDREHDVRAARANQVRPIGVTWGYGSAAELTAAGAALLCDTPAALAALVTDA